MQLLVACGDGTVVVQAAPEDTFGAVLYRVSPWLVHDDTAVSKQHPPHSIMSLFGPVPYRAPPSTTPIAPLPLAPGPFTEFRLLTQRLAYGGRRCDAACTLARAGVQSGSVLQLLHRLRGGGGDGGATGAESRSSYLEMYMDKKPDKVRALWLPWLVMLDCPARTWFLRCCACVSVAAWPALTHHRGHAGQPQGGGAGKVDALPAVGSAVEPALRQR